MQLWRRVVYSALVGTAVAAIVYLSAREESKSAAILLRDFSDIIFTWCGFGWLLGFMLMMVISNSRLSRLQFLVSVAITTAASVWVSFFLLALYLHEAAGSSGH